MTYYANRVKGLGQQMGATVQIAQIVIGDVKSFVAGINSSADWTDAQRALLTSWEDVIVPANHAGQMTLKNDGGALHAEENMAIYIDGMHGWALRWSRAVVGAHISTRTGSRSNVCHTCRALVARVGGSIEPPF